MVITKFFFYIICLCWIIFLLCFMGDSCIVVCWSFYKKPGFSGPAEDIAFKTLLLFTPCQSSCMKWFLYLISLSLNSVHPFYAVRYFLYLETNFGIFESKFPHFIPASQVLLNILNLHIMMVMWYCMSFLCLYIVLCITNFHQFVKDSMITNVNSYSLCWVQGQWLRILL